jgi:hypothetical protein
MKATPRTGLPRLARSTDVIALGDAFVVSAMCSLMGVRLYLFLAGYPKVGGGGLHVAHMIWGGLLMVIALVVAMSFVSVSAHWITAILGGLGFGLFIDEIGKFLTSDNNYFFRPAAALIYVILMALFFSARTIAHRRDFSPEEYLANAIDLLKEAATNDLDGRERLRILQLLHGAGDSPLAAGVRALTRSLEPTRAPSRLQRATLATERRYERVARASAFPRAIGVMVVGGSVLAFGETLGILLVRDAEWSGRPSQWLAGVQHFAASLGFVAWIELLAAAAAIVLSIAGVLLNPARPRGLRMLERAVLIWIIFVQPFAFYEAQFFASAGLFLSLPVLAAVQYTLRAETRREHRATTGSERAVAGYT